MPVPSGSAVDSVMLNDSPTEFVPEIVKTASPSSVFISTAVAVTDSENPCPSV